MVSAIQNLWLPYKTIRIYQVYQGINFAILGIYKFKQKGYNMKYSHFMTKEGL